MIILLELRLGSRVYRVATERVDVSSDDGDIPYVAGLDAGTWESVFAMDGGAPRNDMPIQIAAGVVDVPSVIAAEGAVTGRAELSALRAGATYEQRLRLVEGRISELQYDDRAEPVSFSILATEYRAAKLVPPKDAVLNYPGIYVPGFTFSGDIPPANVGKVASLVFGSPGGYQLSVTRYGAGSFGLIVDDQFTQRAMVICSEPVEASTVYIAWDTDEHLRKFYSATVNNGQSYASNVRHNYAWALEPNTLFLNDPAYPGTDMSEYNQRFLVSWLGGYGVYRPTVREPVKTAGELIEKLLWLGGNVDRGRTAAAVPHLPIQVDGYIDERVDPVEWIRENISSILPVSILEGADGYYPVVARAYLTDPGECPELSVSRREIYPDSPVVFESDDTVANEIIVKYRPDCATRKSTAMVLHSGNPEIQVGSLVATSKAAQQSRQLYGERELQVESKVFDSPHSAHQVAAWLIRRYALPCREMSYAVDPSVDMSRYTVGSGVRISDPDRAISGLCVLESITLDLDGRYTISVRTVNE